MELISRRKSMDSQFSHASFFFVLLSSQQPLNKYQGLEKTWNNLLFLPESADYVINNDCTAYTLFVPAL